jgi:O-antigen/teichoic acid export membrane protein
MAYTVTSSGVGFIFWLFAARVFPDNAVGLGSAVVSGMNLLAMLSILGFNIGIIAYLPHEQEKTKMINSCLSIIGITSFLFALIFLLGREIWSPALSILREPRYQGLFILFTIGTALAMFQINVFVAFRNAKYSFIQSIIGTSRVVILPLIVAMGAFGIFFAYGLGIVVAFTIGNILLKRVHTKYRPKFGIDKKMIKNMFLFSFGNHIAMVFAALPGLILPLIIINLISAEMTAYFYISWMIASTLFTIPGAISMSLFAEGAFKPENLRIEMIKAIKLIYILLIPGIILIYILGDKFLLLFGSGYSDNSLIMLYILAISSISVAINSLYVTVLRVQKKVKEIMYLLVFTTTFTLIMSYLLLTRMGLIGVGIAWLLPNVIVTLIIGVKMIRKIRKP